MLCQVPAFKEDSLIELRKATNEFSTDYIVFESGEKAPNVVYRGKLENNRLVAVKRFSKQSWSDAQQFMAEAAGVGKVRHKRMVNLIGCCAEGDERLLVAEYMPLMPNDSLSKHPFHLNIPSGDEIGYKLQRSKPIGFAISDNAHRNKVTRYSVIFCSLAQSYLACRFAPS